MAVPRSFHFGDCVIDVPARTVVRGNRPQAFEPKVFDTLVYLIEQRARVVPKQELLERVWGTRVVVTEGVVARTIMKIRRLLGDDGDEPAWVKTVHRVGYRFAGEVAQEAPQLIVAASQATRVAVLPFVNRSGSDALAWAEFGLMTATCQALQEGGVEVVAAAELLCVLSARGAADDPLAAAAALASDALQATLEQREPGMLVLTWSGTGRLLAGAHGALSGREPIEMCRRMVAELLPRLDRGGAQAAAPPDPYLHAVRTRAAQATQGERWESARRLLQVAVDATPDDPALQLDLARCLARLRDPLAGPLLERLHHDAKANADAALERRCLSLLARWRAAEGDHAEAERLLSRALSLAEAARDPPAELQLLQAMAELAIDRGRHAIADWLLDRAAALAQTLGDSAALAQTLDSRGRATAACGNRDAATRHFEDALQMHHAGGVQAAAAHTLNHLGDLHAAYGRLVAARQCYAASLDKAITSGDPVAIAIAGLNFGSQAGLLMGRDDVAASTVARMRAVDSRGRIVIATFADLLDALLQARNGRLGECLELLDRAEAGYAGRNFRLRTRYLHTVVLATSGFVDEARDTLQEFLSAAPGGQGSQSALLAQQLLGVCAQAEGDVEQALRHVDAAAHSAPHSLWRLQTKFDAAWLRLDLGDADGAARALDGCRAEFDTALADDHGPAVLLAARLREAAGDGAAAAALRERCPLPPGATYSWALLPRGARCLAGDVLFTAGLHSLLESRRAVA